MRGSEPSSPPDSRIASPLATFAVAYGFYLALGRATDPFDIVTGAVSAGIVTVALSGLVFEEAPSLGRSGGRFLRAVAVLPGLLWEILRANVALAVVLLDPRLPIDPEVVRVESRAESDLERTAVASAITLTPGTVVLDVVEDTFHVHALTAASRESLREGTIERGAAFVFGGREATRDPRMADESRAGSEDRRTGEDRPNEEDRSE
ncbi:Na+/H+ antiporter subunit E [Halorussus lipolyticus]|uniref:Na+/H+ antiporter subunit E n=1 Tax=Halorussus lipolyticus TaxID=3034024 RepID=UPI0023E8E090|nr:Na+/H+ antiporter subunit E [Halorussus sp. DT80]